MSSEGELNQLVKLGRVKLRLVEGPELGVARAAEAGLPLPATFASLAYYDMLRRPRLPLVGAEREAIEAIVKKALATRPAKYQSVA